MEELQTMSEVELLQTHNAVITELRYRGVVQTNNNPIGDYTEWLVCKHLGLEPQPNSQKAFDATGPDGIRYQIKGRRSATRSVQFSPIRNLEQRGFDFVIAVAFNEDYSIQFAVKVEFAAVSTLARYRSHINGHVLILTDNIVEQSGVEDISNLIVD